MKKRFFDPSLLLLEISVSKILNPYWKTGFLPVKDSWENWNNQASVDF